MSYYKVCTYFQLSARGRSQAPFPRLQILCVNSLQTYSSESSNAQLSQDIEAPLHSNCFTRFSTPRETNAKASIDLLLTPRVTFTWLHYFCLSNSLKLLHLLFTQVLFKVHDPKPNSSNHVCYTRCQPIKAFLSVNQSKLSLQTHSERERKKTCFVPLL